MGSLRLVAVLLSACCLVPLVRGVPSCKEVDCGCRDESRGLQLNLTAINQQLESSEPIVGNESSTQYYLDLCRPLNLTGNCSAGSNTSVCAVGNSSGSGNESYTSYGRTGGVAYNLQQKPLLGSTAVNITFNHGDPSGNTSRSTQVRLLCNVSNASSPTVTLDSASSKLLVITIATRDQCIFNITPNATVTSTPATPSPTTSPNTTLTVSSTSQSGGTSSPNATSVPHSPAATSHVGGSTVHPSPSPHNHTSPMPPATATHSPPPSNSPTSPSCPQPTQAPHCHKSSCDCSSTLALALGISIPGTAILTSLITLLLICCCFKVKKKRAYIRLAPMVYYDEDEDRD